MTPTTGTFSPTQVAKIAATLGVADEVNLEQLEIGMEVELEHGRRGPLTNVTDDDPLLTAKIALAHLREMPEYYLRLAAMEAEERRELVVSDVMTPEPLTISPDQTLGNRGSAAPRTRRERPASGGARRTPGRRPEPDRPDGPGQR